MKLLFVHDCPFFISENGAVYNQGSLPSFVWDNYLAFFDTVTVYSRRGNEEHRVTLSSKQNVTFYLTESYNSVGAFFLNYVKIRRELRSLFSSVDVILVRLPSILGFIAGHLALKEGKKIIVEQVGSAYEAFASHGSLLGNLIAPFSQIINKRIVEKSDYIVYVTETKLQKEYPVPLEPYKVLALSDVVIEEIIELNEENVASRFQSSVFKIGLIGGFDTHYKGQDILLKAISRLPSDIKANIELYFIGKGSTNWIIKLAENLNLANNVKTIRALPAGTMILEFLDTLSLYVQPSLTEGMPRALLEAMSRGCPVLGSRVGGIPDVVSHHLLHRGGDFVKLAIDIEILYRDRDLLLREAYRSLGKIKPYLRENLNRKRFDFYRMIVKELSIDKGSN